jgi:hypothetical protein
MTDDYEARQRGHDLAQLRYHWGEAYEIGYDCASCPEQRHPGPPAPGRSP